MKFRKQAGEAQFNSNDSMYRYCCATCGAECYSNHNELSAERFIGASENAKQVRGYGLGTWRCPVHGRTKVKRVPRRKLAA